MGANQFFLLHASSNEGRLCLGIVICHSSDKALQETWAVFRHLITNPVFAQRRYRFGSGGRVALCQCAVEPAVRGTLECSRIFYLYFVNQLMQGPSISFPIEFHERAPDFCVSVIWFDRQQSIQDSLFLRIAPSMATARRSLV